MEYRAFGRTAWQVSEMGFGSWAIGGDAWGQTEDNQSVAALHKAIDLGVNFIDTADVYGDGHSEQLIAEVRKQHSGQLYIATKLGRRLNPHVAEGYNNRQNLTNFVERSLRNLDVETIDLMQLHSPPTAVYDIPEVFGILDDLVQQGKIRYYGVSVEKVEEALKAITYPNVQSVQIIFNMFRLKPAEQFFAAARERKVGVIVRVPLASGLLETFAGVDYETGLQAVEELRALVPEGATMAQFALRWILMYPEVSTVIAGAKNPMQAEDNTKAAALPPLSEDTMRRVKDVYGRLIREQVQDRW